MGFSAADVSREAKIAPRYLAALEAGDYELLSAPVYGISFLKKVLIVLRVDNVDAWVRELRMEWDERAEVRARDPLGAVDALAPDAARVQKRVAGGIALVVAGAAALVVGMQVRNFIGKPTLVIDEPQDRAVVEKPAIQVRGHTERESRLTVNGREITIDEQGGFVQQIELAPGLNELEFRAENRFGKESKAMRYVVVH